MLKFKWRVRTFQILGIGGCLFSFASTVWATETVVPVAAETKEMISSNSPTPLASSLLKTAVVAASKKTKHSTGKKAATVKTPPTAGLPPLLVEIETKYGNAKTLRAKFSQVTYSTIGQKKESNGVIHASKPGKIRWETSAPDPSILTSDGKTYWYYTPPFDEGEHGQLLIRKSAEVQSKFANALLSGSFSMTKKMDIRKNTESRYFIFPRVGTAGTVRKVELEVDPKEKLIRKVILEHEGGNRAEINLSEIQLGLDLAEDLFTFKAPPNTDVVNP